MEMITGSGAKKSRTIQMRQARAATARQLQASARENSAADRAGGQRGRKVPGAGAFSFLNGASEKLGG